jgi:SAM-dependent methyltransferase
LVLFAVPYSDAALRASIERFHPHFDWQWVDGQQYTVLHCPSCGTLFQRAVFDEMEAKRFYNLPSHQSYALKPLKLSSLAHIAQEVILLRQLLDSARPRVLDYGMGWANWATMALAFGCEVAGVEINEQARGHAAGRGIAVLQPEDLKDGSFDFIQVDQVLEHLTDPLALLSSLASKLRKDGLALVGVPGRANALAAFRCAAQSADPFRALPEADLDALSPLVHLTLFNSRSLRRLAARVGLELFRPALGKSLAAGTLWNTPRQWNRNLYLPFKFWLGNKTRLWFKRTA